MKTKGFTLIELMIVVAILGILLAIAIPMITGTPETEYSHGLYGRIETRCIKGYEYVIGADRQPKQVMSEAGKGVPCQPEERELR